MATATEIINLLLEDKRVTLTVPSTYELHTLYGSLRALKSRMDKQFQAVAGESISEGKVVGFEVLSETDEGLKVTFMMREPKQISKQYNIVVE